MTSSEKKIDHIEAAARDWFLLQQERALNETESEAFNAWLEVNSQHAIAYQQLEAIWQGLGEVETEELSEHHSLWQRLMQWMGVEENTKNDERQEKTFTWGLSPTMGAMASFAAVLIVTGLWFSGNLGLQSDVEHYQHDIAEVRTHLLSDQTLVTLGADSELLVTMEREQRIAQLVKGQAFFDVAKDSQRPFYVNAGGTKVKVVGTRFEVHKTQSLVRVSVEEGRVQVSPAVDEDKPLSLPLLTAGQRIVSSEGGLGEVESMVTHKVSPWRDGRLVYRDARLSEVVFDVNRYRNTKIILGSDALKTMKVTTSFSVDQADSIVSLLEQSLPIVAHRETENRVLILPKSKLL